MKYSLENIILEIHNKEDKILSVSKRLIDEAYEMTVYLQNLLFSVKKYIIENEFKNDAEEIHFFRTIKPQILGKLIYYNKVYRIEFAIMICFIRLPPIKVVACGYLIKV
ncbi:RteC domain-containing protein [Sphingobacterium hotanense]|uniref:RteC domain-containing protein n=1 Tax=Sphingobacterium hotanense TaxID=649196 RepID=UPI002575A3A6|nr:RteC domain-containing protein [Sphingobacterium hotanense]